jgi:ubiquinone/menaquinone biosynthesis C-methylase UbiE
MNSVPDPYADMADIYDSYASLGDIQAIYSEWRDSLLNAIREQRLPVRTLVDLACGTGNSAIPWASQKSWRVIGIDRSRAMLAIARNKSKKVRWICQDLRKLKIGVRADVATCHFDALNHILKASELHIVFKKVAATLNKGGLFQFDLNTDFWFRWLSTHEKLFRMGPNYLVSYNEYDPTKRIVTFHQLWFLRHKRAFQKREIIVREASYTQTQIRSMLRLAGFRLVRTTVVRIIEGKPIRLLYIARKIGD